MSSDFRILVHRNSECLHLRLEGDFDEEAAREVVFQIGANVNGAGRVFIHTNGLGRILPPGPQAFQEGLPLLGGGCVSYIFTGDKATEIAPRGHRILV